MKSPSNRLLIILAGVCVVSALALFGRYLPSPTTLTTPNQIKNTPAPISTLEQFNSIEIERTTAVTDKVDGERSAKSDFSSDVNWFLNSENSDMAKLFDQGERRSLARARLASVELINKLVPCLEQKSKCPYYPKDNQDYYFMGGTPVFHALERAFEFFEMAQSSGQNSGSVLSSDVLHQAMRLPHTGVSFKAAALLLTTSPSPEEKVATLKDARVLGPKARAMLLQYAAGMKEDRTGLEFSTAFNQAVHDSVAKGSDAFTRSETVKRLDQLDLDQETFKRVAATSCRMAIDSDARTTVRAVLQRKAKASGFDFSAAELCSN